MPDREAAIQAMSHIAMENGIVAVLYVPGEDGFRMVNPYGSSLWVEGRLSSGPMPQSGVVCDPRIDIVIGREAARLRD